MSPVIRRQELSRLKTKLNTQRQKYIRMKMKWKKLLKSVEETPRKRIEKMSEDVNKIKELVRKALFGKVLQTQLKRKLWKY